MTNNQVELLAQEIGCGFKLARDLLILAGEDEKLVIKASNMCNGVESMKAFIIDERFKKIEQ